MITKKHRRRFAVMVGPLHQRAWRESQRAPVLPTVASMALHLPTVAPWAPRLAEVIPR